MSGRAQLMKKSWNVGPTKTHGSKIWDPEFIFYYYFTQIKRKFWDLGLKTVGVEMVIQKKYLYKVIW